MHTSRAAFHYVVMTPTVNASIHWSPVDKLCFPNLLCTQIGASSKVNFFFTEKRNDIFPIHSSLHFSRGRVAVFTASGNLPACVSVPAAAPLHPEHIFEPQYGKIYMLSAASPSLPGGAAPSPPLPFTLTPSLLGQIGSHSCRVRRHGGRSVVHLFCSDQLRQFQPAPPSTERGGWVQPPSLGDA